MQGLMPRPRRRYLRVEKNYDTLVHHCVLLLDFAFSFFLTLRGGGVPSFHPSLGLSVFFLSSALLSAPPPPSEGQRKNLSLSLRARTKKNLLSRRGRESARAVQSARQHASSTSTPGSELRHRRGAPRLHRQRLLLLHPLCRPAGRDHAGRPRRLPTAAG